MQTGDDNYGGADRGRNRLYGTTSDRIVFSTMIFFVSAILIFVAKIGGSQ